MRSWFCLASVWIGLSVAASALTAQLPLPTRQGAPGDTVQGDPFRFEPPISALGAFGRSMLLPGWGQAKLGRRVTGAFFVAFEGVALTMTLKASHQLSYMERVGHEATESKRQERKDWLVLLVFNHLMSGAEAFVAAQLWDFPDELRFQAYPDGRVGVTASLPLPRGF